MTIEEVLRAQGERLRHQLPEAPVIHVLPQEPQERPLLDREQSDGAESPAAGVTLSR